MSFCKILYMANKISNPADISEKNCKILSSYWKEIYNQENTPSNFFAALPHDLMAEFNEKLELHCRQILTKGFNQWAFGKYRIDHNKNDGVLALSSDVFEYLLTSSENEKFVNLKEVFKYGEKQINKNLNKIIKQVLAGYRYRTVIDTLLRRIEQIADDNSNNIVRNRTEIYGPKADYFTLVNKFPEERDPTRNEIEKVISLVGRFKETPAKKDAKQASRIYTTKQLIEMMEIISDSLPTDVTPNTLERIFIDLIPDFLPKEFLREKVFKIEGDGKFVDALLFDETESNTNLSDLEQSEQIEIKEILNDVLDLVEKKNLRDQCKIIKNYLIEINKELNLKDLLIYDIFTSIEQVEETFEFLREVTNRIYFTASNEQVGEIAYKNFFDEL